MILLVDANVLIDLWCVNGLAALSRLACTEVLDVVLDECDTGRNPGLAAQLQSVGISVIQSQPTWQQPAQQFRTRGLSYADALCLYYAWRHGRILLTGEKLLRQQCAHWNVTVHGTLWVIDEVHRLDVLSGLQLCEWLRILLDANARLPRDELEARIARFQAGDGS